MSSLLPCLRIFQLLITAIDVLEENPDLITKLNKNIVVLCQGLTNIHGLKIVSDVKSPIVFLGLKNSTGSLKSDSQLLEHIAEQVLKKDSVSQGFHRKIRVDVFSFKLFDFKRILSFMHHEYQ